MSHIHLLQSIDTSTGGGLVGASLQLAKAQELIGNNVKVISTTNGDTSNNILDYKVDIYKRFIDNPFLYAPGMWEGVFNSTFQEDIVHNHGLYIYSSYLTTKLINKKDITSVIHVHGMFEPWILKRSRWKKRIVGILFEDYKLTRANYWRALTNKEADQIKAQNVHGNIIVLPNGININEIAKYKSSEKVREKEKKSLLFLGRLHEKKGLLPFLKTFLSIPDNVKSKWTFDIVGPNDGIMSQLVNIAKNDPLIKFHGEKNGLEKYRLLHNADAFILPSYSEGFSMAVLEAMAFSKPVIITDECNFEESYNYGALRLSSDTNHWKAECKKILLMSEEELIQRGEGLYNLVKQKYTWEKIAKELDYATIK